MIFSLVNVENYRSIERSGDIQLGPITVLVGRNNSGKSSLIRAMYLLQQGAPFEPSDIRHGESVMRMRLQATGRIPFNLGAGQRVPDEYTGGQVVLEMNAQGSLKFSAETADQYIGLTAASNAEPNNLIFPVLSGRRPYAWRQQVSRANAMMVGHEDSFLVSKIADLLANDLPESRRFREICERTLGLNFGVINTDNNTQTLGIKITRTQEILIDAMGAGLSAALNLIASLSTATGNQLFLVEEPENDLHPAALKNLLQEIISSSQTNQFVISTHSNIVLSFLGSARDTSVVEVSSDGARPPKSSYAAIDDAPSRLRVLRDLGYELSDFGLGEGWLIFEESTAEFLVRSWFIPAFAPSLGILRTVAATGVTRIRPMFRDIHEMFLFAHLEEVYKGRVWVVADGDPAGVEAVDQLKTSYKSWDQSHFRNWDVDDFEQYYPPEFTDEAAAVLRIDDGRKKKAAKGALAQRVWNWIREDETRARAAFEVSAATVVATLRDIEQQVRDLSKPWAPTVEAEAEASG